MLQQRGHDADRYIGVHLVHLFIPNLVDHVDPVYKTFLYALTSLLSSSTNFDLDTMAFHQYPARMNKTTNIKPVSAKLYFLPVQTRVPLKFGSETLTYVTCARVCMTVENSSGEPTEGWGETPLSVQWVWPCDLPYEERHQAMKDFCSSLSDLWSRVEISGHPMEIGHHVIFEQLPNLLINFNSDRKPESALPWLAALVCCSAFDIALHDAYGNANNIPVYKSYNADYMNRDLSAYLTPDDGSDVSFQGKYPQDYFTDPVPKTLPAWHLVGGKDLIDKSELTGDEPDDGYPVLLADWIKRDGLTCLKVKLRGNDPEWDYDRLVKTGTLGKEHGVEWLTTDFNCMVTDPAYVNDILDKLKTEFPALFDMILYVEQPFPYDLEENRIDVHSVSEHKPLFMDESAHDWHLVKLGYSLGWTGVALKTCKTQTGALLSLCWGRAHDMQMMVQDLTNPMLAQIPHVLLAAHAGTIMGVETNAMQFYPEASLPEAEVHPGLYRRINGCVDLSSLRGPGFGYRLSEIKRKLT